MAVKKFTPRASSAKKAEPIEFEVYDQTFTAVPTLPGIALLSFMSALDNRADGESENQANARIMAEIVPFFEAALEEESYKRFMKVASNPETPLEIEDLVEIISYLIEKFTTPHPTTGSSK